MKWIVMLLLAALVAGAWYLFDQSGKEIKELERKITAIEDSGDYGLQEELPKLEDQMQTKSASRILHGVLLTFVSAGLAGILVVTTILPYLAQRATHAIYDSGEMVEKDIMREARSLEAQGEYQAAIAAFQRVAAEEPGNRLPWVEIIKIQKEHLHDPEAAIATIRHILENIPQEPSDAAFFLFRLAELHDETQSDRAGARAIMQQIIDQFPNTRHSANATHKLHEWDIEEGASATDAEEAAYLARMQRDGDQAS